MLKIPLDSIVDKNLKSGDDVFEGLEEGSYLIVDRNNIPKTSVSSELVEEGVIKKILDEYETLRTIVEEVGEGIAAIDKDGNVILWNRFMEERYSIKSEDIIGKKMGDILQDTISERALRTSDVMSDIYYTKKIDTDSDLYGVVHAKPVMFNDEFEGVICTEVDVKEISRLSNELKVAKERLYYLENQVIDYSKNAFDNILGKSESLEKAKKIAKRVAKTNSSVFIYGESGTGKEIFAKAIHQYSDRQGTFIPVNCSAIPGELFESEFFGYEAGSFTGASRKGKAGIFELASGGTVFLDEIADLPLAMQAKLLRVLQEKEIRRVGGSDIISVNARIIAATNKDIKDMVRKGEFREDLYYRLNVVEIDLPPLRERSEDIGILIYHFLEEVCSDNRKPFIKIGSDAFEILQKYRWKGNLRELRNTIESMVVLCNGNIIGIEDIPHYIIKSVNESSEQGNFPMDLGKAIEQLEISKIKEALELSGGNKSLASKILNIPRSTLYYKMESYKIEN